MQTKSLCIDINYLDKSFFALSLGFLKADHVVEENWNMTWNKNVMLTNYKEQHQQFLPPSPIILSAPVPGIPKCVQC